MFSPWTKNSARRTRFNFSFLRRMLDRRNRPAIRRECSCSFHPFHRPESEGLNERRTPSLPPSHRSRPLSPSTATGPTQHAHHACLTPHVRTFPLSAPSAAATRTPHRLRSTSSSAPHKPRPAARPTHATPRSTAQHPRAPRAPLASGPPRCSLPLSLPATRPLRGLPLRARHTGEAGVAPVVPARFMASHADGGSASSAFTRRWK